MVFGLKRFRRFNKKNHSLSITEKVDPKEYEAAWESVLDCVDGMKEEFSWSKDVITKMLRELAEKVESEED